MLYIYILQVYKISIKSEGVLAKPSLIWHVMTLNKQRSANRAKFGPRAAAYFQVARMAMSTTKHQRKFPRLSNGKLNRSDSMLL